MNLSEDIILEGFAQRAKTRHPILYGEALERWNQIQTPALDQSELSIRLLKQMFIYGYIEGVKSQFKEDHSL